MSVPRLVALLAVVAACGCGADDDAGGGTAAGAGGGGGASGGAGGAEGGAGGAAGGTTATGGAGGAATSGGWHLTVYFTAVEGFFSDAAGAVSGCLVLTCDAPGDPDNALGSYPQGFLTTVQDEGTGAIESGPHAGEYLNWSAGQPGSGYWLDSAPRDAQGGALTAYLSAAAHPSQPFGATFTVAGCGVDSTTGEPMDAVACDDLRAGAWQIRDRFEADDELRHLDLYIGLQTALDMNDDPHFVDQVEAETTLP